MLTYVYVDIKTALPSGASFRATLGAYAEGFALLDSATGDFLMRLPAEVRDTPPNTLLYEDSAISVRS
jgi:hypothetical protein